MFDQTNLGAHTSSFPPFISLFKPVREVLGITGHVHLLIVTRQRNRVFQAVIERGGARGDFYSGK